MASVPCHAWADEEGTTVDLVQVMCPRKLKVTNNRVLGCLCPQWKSDQGVGF